MINPGFHRGGRKEPCQIVFEAGATHDGLASALELAELSAEAGADAVKFQIFDPDRLVADKTVLFSYQVLEDRDTGRVTTVNEPLYDILCRRTLTEAEWQKVRNRCRSLELAFFATVGFEEDIRLLERLSCDSIKIASADINHWPLIRLAAETGMSIQLDTGNASLGEVESAVDICRNAGNENIIIHNCPSGYPARLESINLNLIHTLKQMFPGYAVAYSDHSPGWEMDVAAVAMGADLLEKTITLDRCQRSPEHMFSLEPKEMKEFIHIIRDVEKAMGSPRRILGAKERQMQLTIRRSAFLKTAVKRGEIVTPELIDFRRPGTGIAPDQFEPYYEKAFARDLDGGTCLSPGDFL